MVLCTFFLNNNCRFGNQCKNEHVNVVTVVQTDIDGAIKGNQWPLSCYGPFRDKPSIANFIEDQSYEELRALCYDAQKQGTLQNHVQQLNQQFLDAKNKMSQLFEMKNESLSVIVSLYNASDDPNRSSTSNPFAVANQQQTSSVFGTNSNATNPFASNVFGGNTSSSIFGATAAATTTGTSSLFGSSSFGGNSSGNSLFGSPQSVFGGAPATASPFALSQIGQPEQTSSSNVFGGSQQQSFQGGSFFGSSGASAFGASAAQNTGLFAQANAALPSQPSGMFGQSSVFGGQTQQQSSIFATPTASQQPAFAGQTNSSNPFGSAPINQNIFGNAHSTAPPTSQNIFGAAQPMQNQFSSNAGPFAAAAPQPDAAAAPSIFGNANSFQAQPIQPTASTDFGNMTTQQPQQSVFGGNAFGATPAPPSSNVDETIYRLLEQIKPEELEAFKADKFELGKIPSLPPPRELCH